MDVMDDIAAQNNWELDYVQDTWPRLLEKLKTGEIDVLTGIAYSEQRAQRFDFSNQILVSNWGVIYRNPSAKVSSILDLQGKRVALIAGATHSLALISLLEKFDVTYTEIPVKSYVEAFEFVARDRADVAVVSRLFGVLNASANTVVATTINFNPVEVRFASPKGTNADVLAVIDQYLLRQKNEPDSNYHLSLQRWLGVAVKKEIPDWVLFAITGIIALLGVAVFAVVWLRREVAKQTKSLREREELSRRLIENLPEIVYTLSTKSGGLCYSPHVKDILGYSPEDLKQRPHLWHDKIDPDHITMVDQAMQDLRTGKHYDHQYRLRDAKGGWHWFHDRSTMIRENNDELLVDGIVTDITAQRKAERQLRQAQKMEVLGQLTGGIAHDFNNMLGGIIGYSELLEKRACGQGDPKIDYYVHEILTSGRRATSMISQMMDFSRGEIPTKSNVDVIANVKEAVRLMASIIPSSIHMSLNTETAVPLVEANSVQLHQVLMNICLNARDAIDGAQGSIEIKVGHHTRPKDLCSSCHEEISGDFVELTIKDNGGGMPADVSDSVFIPFFTTKEIGEGSGMGLAMVHGIIHGFGGHIMLEVEEGVGTTIHLLLPVASSQVADLPAAAEDHIPGSSLDGVRVLVVDDEAALAELLKEELEDAGCLVSVYTDSRTVAERIKNELDQFDIMITDQTMPEFSGADLVRIFKEIEPDFPIIVYSGYSPYMNQDIAEQLGVNKFLTKPVSLQDMIQAVHDVMKTTSKAV